MSLFVVAVNRETEAIIEDHLLHGLQQKEIIKFLYFFYAVTLSLHQLHRIFRNRIYFVDIEKAMYLKLHRQSYKISGDLQNHLAVV